MNIPMEKIITVIVSIPYYYWAGGAAVLFGLIFTAAVMINRRKIYKTAQNLFDKKESDPLIREKLLSKPSLLEKLIKNKGEDVIAHFQAAEYLVSRFIKKNKTEDARRLLKLAPEEGIYPVFSAALSGKRLEQFLLTWFRDNLDFYYLRIIAVKSRGEKFNEKKAEKLLSEYLELVRELTGDPEWPARFFALKIIMLDNSEKSIRLVKEAFKDPYPYIRKTVAENIKFLDTDELFGNLITLVLDDPVPEVRHSARLRIDREFPERWKLEPSGMEPLQMIHVLELLKTDSTEDRNTAVTALLSQDSEAKLSAARFLEKSGTLEKILMEADRGDLEDWNRKLLILENAVSTGITDFIGSFRNTDSVDVLLLAAKLLSISSNNSLIYQLAQKTFSLHDPTETSDKEELYKFVIQLSCEKGNDSTHKLIIDELKKRKNNKTLFGFVLPLLPKSKAYLFRELFIDFLKEPGLPAEEIFIETVSDFPYDLFLGSILDILEADRADYSHEIRKRAFSILLRWHLEQTVQIILENLSVMPVEEHDFVSEMLSEIDNKVLKDRIAFILSSPDSAIRTAVISTFPPDLARSFLKEIKDALNDSDPDVRIAAFRTLFKLGEAKAAGATLAVLKDPVFKVREAAVVTAAEKGSGKFLGILEEILNDESESDSVRKAVIKGLSSASNVQSVGILVKFLENDKFTGETINALSAKTDKKSLIALVESFKDTEAVIRDKISEAFIAMGEKGEDALVALMKEEISSLKPFISEILTRTGFVEMLILKLRNRKSSIRRSAAELLAEIATDAAYRGIILAARDPDRDVRIKVTKALEMLATPAGESILKSLENDPDKKVRKYTKWAMERVKAKNLV